MERMRDKPTKCTFEMLCALNGQPSQSLGMFGDPGMVTDWEIFICHKKTSDEGNLKLNLKSLNSLPYPFISRISYKES